MADIIKIVIKGSSGFGPADLAFNDKVTITAKSIFYEYTPMMETETNPKQKWSYKTESTMFKMAFDSIKDMTAKVIAEPMMEFCTDIGGIEFNVTYSDKSKIKETYWVPSDRFADLFRAIKKLVPEMENVPEVLKTEEDYEDE